ncbi:MAG: hypothetical protein DDT39_00034 [Firmicutes bacterium]|nr:hypothetical protein [candidate division NPL-UPA2 bacterium]
MHTDMPPHDQHALQTLIETTLRQGYAISVKDDENKWGEPLRDYADIIDRVAESEFDVLALHRDGAHVGWLMLVYGNAPDELIADYADTPACQDLHDAWVAKMEAK